MLPGHLNTGALNLFKPMAILAHQKYWRAKQIKHLDFFPKIIVISKKKVLTSKQSLKTSDVEKKQEKNEFLHKTCLRFLAAFLPKWAGQSPKKNPKNCQ